MWSSLIKKKLCGVKLELARADQPPWGERGVDGDVDLIPASFIVSEQGAHEAPQMCWNAYDFSLKCHNLAVAIDWEALAPSPAAAAAAFKIAKAMRFERRRAGSGHPWKIIYRLVGSGGGRLSKGFRTIEECVFELVKLNITPTQLSSLLYVPADMLS